MKALIDVESHNIKTEVELSEGNNCGTYGQFYDCGGVIIWDELGRDTLDYIERTTINMVHNNIKDLKDKTDDDIEFNIYIID